MSEVVDFEIPRNDPPPSTATVVSASDRFKASTHTALPEDFSAWDELDNLPPLTAYSVEEADADIDAAFPPEDLPELATPKPKKQSAGTVGGIVAEMEEFFPFEVIRPTQAVILDAAAQSIYDQKKFLLVEAPTGVGKTGISMTLAGHAAEYPVDEDDSIFKPGATILTSQKTLSAQMVADFGYSGLVELRGKRNYHCDRHRTDCETGSVLNQSGRPCEACPYRRAKNKFIGAPRGVTNYAYFIAETRYGGELPPKDVLVLDEAHNVEREILAVANIAVTSKHTDILDVPGGVPNFAAGQEGQAKDWIHNRLMPKLELYIHELQRQAEQAETQGASRESTAYKRDLAEYTNFGERLSRFTKDGNTRDWLSWTDDSRVLNIKPLIPALWTDELLFKHARRIVLMSATILDFKTFRQTLGIRPSQALSIQTPSEFHKDNRRIIFWPAGSMSFKNIGDTMPTMLKRIGLLANKNFKDMKGIIHTHTYKINEQVVAYLRANPETRHRVITHGRTTESREKAILDHCTRPDNSILVSPSMTEGLDLKHDLSRFQIICKVPFPFLDPYNKARKERSPEWYRMQTAITLVQATGRSIRSVDDYALSIIMDSDFAWFMTDASSILPDWWKEAIEVK